MKHFCAFKVFFFIQIDSNDSANSNLCSIWHYFSSLACKYHFYRLERVNFHPVFHSQSTGQVFFFPPHNQLYSLPRQQATIETCPFAFWRGKYFERTCNGFRQSATSFGQTNQVQFDTGITRIIVLGKKKLLHTPSSSNTARDYLKTCWSHAAYKIQYCDLLSGKEVYDSITLSSHWQKATSICISLC